MDIQNLWIPKIVGGAYKDIVSDESDLIHHDYTIYCVTNRPEKFVGSDFFKFDVHEDNEISLVVGDITSHGLNVSQGALVALTAYNIADKKNPKKVIENIHKALMPIKKEHGGETLALAILLKENGLIIYNGVVDQLKIFNVDEKKEIQLPTNGTLIGKSAFFKAKENMTYTMNSGDNLIILTDGATNNDREDDKTSIIITYNKAPKEDE